MRRPGSSARRSRRRRRRCRGTSARPAIAGPRRCAFVTHGRRGRRGRRGPARVSPRRGRKKARRRRRRADRRRGSGTRLRAACASWGPSVSRSTSSPSAPASLCASRPCSPRFVPDDALRVLDFLRGAGFFFTARALAFARAVPARGRPPSADRSIASAIASSPASSRACISAMPDRSPIVATCSSKVATASSSAVSASRSSFPRAASVRFSACEMTPSRRVGRSPRFAIALSNDSI